MKKTLLLAMVMIVLSPVVQAQTTEAKSKPLEIFKTADDFFSNTKTKLGECYSRKGHKFKCADGKEIDLKAIDCFGFTWEGEGDEIGSENLRIVLHPRNKAMLTYMGGCKELMFYMPASVGVSGKFAENGDFQEGTISSIGERPEFIKDVDFKKKTLNLEQAISGKPEVGKNFKVERETMTANEWGRNRLYFYNKYVRQYCDGEKK